MAYYVLETLSVIAQVTSYRVFGRRIFEMAPVHHHFELVGWPETTVIVRFWILAGLFTALCARCVLRRLPGSRRYGVTDRRLTPAAGPKTWPPQIALIG